MPAPCLHLRGGGQAGMASLCLCVALHRARSCCWSCGCLSVMGTSFPGCHGGTPEQREFGNPRLRGGSPGERALSQVWYWSLPSPQPLPPAAAVGAVRSAEEWWHWFVTGAAIFDWVPLLGRELGGCCFGCGVFFLLVCVGFLVCCFFFSF